MDEWSSGTCFGVNTSYSGSNLVLCFKLCKKFFGLNKEKKFVKVNYFHVRAHGRMNGTVVQTWANNTSCSGSTLVGNFTQDENKKID